ncbi:MAG: hypothetical protein M3403_00970 [Gemmatimonadota bacterium]|nr:hypothetical protein [Gemmatimonadota bacterium]
MVVSPPGGGTRPSPSLILVALLLVAGGVVARRRWWVFRANRAEVDDALSTTCRMMLVRLLVTSPGYEIYMGATALGVVVSRRGPALQLTFRGPWRAGKKNVLVRNLFAKQFEPIVPRLRIRLRRLR